MRWALLLLFGLAIAGCADEPGGSDLRLADGSPNQDAPETPSGPLSGTIAGVVVDEARVPVAGANVTIAQVARLTTGADGTFGIVTVPEGSHRVVVAAAGHESTTLLIDVRAGETKDLKLILLRSEAAQPYREFFEFQGYMDVTATGLYLSSAGAICECLWDFPFVPENVTALLLEATHEGYAWPTGGTSEIWVFGEDPARDQGLIDIKGDLPLRHEAEPPVDASGSMRLSATITSSPLPEFQKEYEVFLTFFHHEQIPDGYSMLEART